MKSALVSLKVGLLTLALFFATSCNDGPADKPIINGVEGPEFNVVDGKLIVVLKFLNFELDGGIGGVIPHTHGSEVQFAPNVVDGGMMLQMNIDVEDLKELDIGIGNANELPDGRPLPVPGGQLENSLRADVEFNVGSTKLRPSFYFHKKLFGIWMPFGFETAGLSGYFKVKIGANAVGTISLVGNEPGNAERKAGGLLFLRLEKLNHPAFKRIVQLSKQNPHKTYRLN